MKNLSPMSTTGTIANVVFWASASDVPQSALQDAMDHYGVEDFTVPSVLSPQRAFAAIMRSHYHTRFKSTQGTIQKT
jgi:hypothetical protein